MCRELDYALVSQLDHEFTDHTIASVGDETITTENGWSLVVEQTNRIVPQPGMTARYWGRGIGHPVRGLAINGVLLRYKTAAEYNADMDARLAAEDARRAEEFARGLEKMEQQIAGLSPVLRERVKRLRARHTGDPEHSWLPYELCILTDAQRIADTLKTSAAIAAFERVTDFGEQQRLVPGLSEEHSGFTFGAAIATAKWLLTDPDRLLPAME